MFIKSNCTKWISNNALAIINNNIYTAWEIKFYDHLRNIVQGQSINMYSKKKLTVGFTFKYHFLQYGYIICIRMYSNIFRYELMTYQVCSRKTKKVNISIGCSSGLVACLPNKSSLKSFNVSFMQTNCTRRISTNALAIITKVSKRIIFFILFLLVVQLKPP